MSDEEIKMEQKCLRSPEVLTDTFQHNPLDSNLPSNKHTFTQDDKMFQVPFKTVNIATTDD